MKKLLLAMGSDILMDEGVSCMLARDLISYFPDFASFLVKEGIESMSLNSDTIIKTTLLVAEKEKTTFIRPANQKSFGANS